MYKVYFRKLQLASKGLKLFLCLHKEESESNNILTDKRIFCIRMWHANNLTDTLISKLINLIFSVLEDN